jgi:hypothetical protein
LDLTSFFDHKKTVEPFNDTEPISFLANFYSLSHKLSNRVKDILLAEELPAKGVSFCHLPDTRAPGAGIGRKPTALFAKKNFHKKSCSRALMRVIGSQHWLWMAANDKFGEPTPRKH